MSTLYEEYEASNYKDMKWSVKDTSTDFIITICYGKFHYLRDIFLQNLTVQSITIYPDTNDVVVYVNMNEYMMLPSGKHRTLSNVLAEMNYTVSCNAFVYDMNFDMVSDSFFEMSSEEIRLLSDCPVLHCDFVYDNITDCRSIYVFIEKELILNDVQEI